MSSSLLAEKYNVSKNTIGKWRKREKPFDRSSTPHTIHYAIPAIEQEIIKSVRRTTWTPLDEIVEIAQQLNPTISRSAVYRTLKRANLNKVPQKEREKAKKFKAYEPGFLHIDVTYLPKIDGIKYYLFVAIDRATRTLFYHLYDAKTSDNAEDFMKKCIDFFPFKITHVLTDNGLEFTNKSIKSKKGKACTKSSKLDVVCKNNNIDHRLTKPNTPKTNGMVERANGIIKTNTILKEKYNNKEHLKDNLLEFLVYYLLYRRHGSLKKELGVKTPFQAITKWYELKPDIFYETPNKFKEKILLLHHNITKCKGKSKQQPCET